MPKEKERQAEDEKLDFDILNAPDGEDIDPPDDGQDFIEHERD